MVTPPLALSSIDTDTATDAEIRTALRNAGHPQPIKTDRAALLAALADLLPDNDDTDETAPDDIAASILAGDSFPVLTDAADADDIARSLAVALADMLPDPDAVQATRKSVQTLGKLSTTVGKVPRHAIAVLHRDAVATVRAVWEGIDPDSGNTVRYVADPDDARTFRGADIADKLLDPAVIGYRPDLALTDEGRDRLRILTGKTFRHGSDAIQGIRKWSKAHSVDEVEMTVRDAAGTWIPFVLDCLSSYNDATTDKTRRAIVKRAANVDRAASALARVGTGDRAVVFAAETVKREGSRKPIKAPKVRTRS